MKTINISNGKGEMYPLSTFELVDINGGVDPAEGSYSAGYAVGSWFREMYNIWSYGLTHLNDH